MRTIYTGIYLCVIEILIGSYFTNTIYLFSTYVSRGQRDALVTVRVYLTVIGVLHLWYQSG